MDLDLPQVSDGFDLQAGEAGQTSSPVQQASSTSYVISQESEEAAAAPLHRTRARKPIKSDRRPMLRRREMAGHDNTYLTTMILQQKEHLLRRLPIQAKKNADYFILGRGLNGIGTFLHPNIPYPLSIFSGGNLYEWATGKPFRIASNKRSSDESELDERRVRSRLDGYELVRNATDDVDMTLFRGDDVERARERAPELTDISSVLPWNISASARGSSVQRIGSAVVPSSATRRTRMASASPLHGRGPVPVIDEEGYHMIEDFVKDPVVDEAGQDNTSAAEVIIKYDVALDTESSNFLKFVQGAIAAKQDDAEQLAVQLNTQPEPIDNVTFEELLPPQTNIRESAAYGLLHVLSLATKDLIRVTQTEGFGPISITVV
jgi:meiotic recombination protein REC8, fungi type